MARKVVLSGMQPTGRLHLGNYEGALKNWVGLQDEYDMYCCIVDWHALTSDFDDTSGMKDNIFDMAVDYLASGLDGKKCAIFIQSQVKEHAELHLLFSMIIPIPWLERVPSYKEKSQSLGLDSYGFLGYPLLQSADILLYRADFVPVGKDQLPHIELTREVARKFHALYGDVFPEPQAKLTKFAEVPGTDGRKMSKSYENDICLADTPEETAKKISTMFTDPEKLRMGDPGHPERCPVYSLHKIYTTDGLDKIAETCRSGELGCVADKKHLIESINSALAPVRAKRAELESHPDVVWDVLSDGASRARLRAAETMEMVRSAMRLIYE
ncbi:MAG: tryptophan--tRNA ligase [candidate division Zixibacteria bacterium]|nr:tryptophan--tRNA ligase [candidate division Zixibacteria bacterium]MBU1471556.1 tryptophan--tRNA ligase [candidate division Zixibacteria bacterium]MBU2626331.1 tryptophan--tRNA ligase [candidate division Zixibacteria bacterium]